ncbi:hypothetical protein O3Q51_06510 [Cryomorphaceae bacterium 1068]|nr:hypothetical protein [Cryomorphaceae bacterium 1068]
MKFIYINFIKAITLVTICILTFSCKKEGGYSGNIDHAADLSFTVPFSFIPGDTIIWEEDIDSGINYAINTELKEHDNASLVRLEIVNLAIRSSDVSTFSYLDSLAIHMASRNLDETAEYGIPENALFISSVGPEKLSEASFNGNLQNVNVKGIFTNTDNFNIYYECFLNDGILQIQQDRNIELSITFRALIES